jgi:hypothetical protein
MSNTCKSCGCDLIYDTYGICPNLVPTRGRIYECNMVSADALANAISLADAMKHMEVARLNLDTRSFTSEIRKLLERAMRLLNDLEKRGSLRPGDPICNTSCPCCGAELSVQAGDDPGEVGCVGVKK